MSTGSGRRRADWHNGKRYVVSGTGTEVRYLVQYRRYRDRVRDALYQQLNGR